MTTKPHARQTCFVIGPIGEANSPEREHADWLYDGIIVPVFNEHFPQFDVSRADKISKPGSISNQLINDLHNADLVVADLSTLNPNAFYELGIRHTVRKQTIHICHEDFKLPFDVLPIRTIFFSRRQLHQFEKAKTDLRSMVEEAIKADAGIDNPVTQARGFEHISESANSKEQVLLNQINSMATRLSALERYLKKLQEEEDQRRFRPVSAGSLRLSDLARHFPISGSTPEQQLLFSEGFELPVEGYRLSDLYNAEVARKNQKS